MCKRVPRSELPANVTLSRRYRGGVAAGRRRRPPKNVKEAAEFLILRKKQQKNPLVKQLGKKALTYAPKLYKYGASKVKNKTARNILNSAGAEQLLNKVASYRLQVILKTSLKTKKNDDLEKNLMGVYSSNSVRKYINFYEILKAKIC